MPARERVSTVLAWTFLTSGMKAVLIFDVGSCTFIFEMSGLGSSWGWRDGWDRQVFRIEVRGKNAAEEYKGERRIRQHSPAGALF